MRVRTSWQALAAAAVLSGVLAVSYAGDGSPPSSTPSMPATEASTRGGLPPGAGVQPILAAQGADSAGAGPADAPARPLHGTLDQYILTALRGAAGYLLVFLTLHSVARLRGWSGRWTYAAFGSAAALACALAVLSPVMWAALASSGQVSQVFVSASFEGAILGFLYIWRAGLEEETDAQDAITRALSRADGAAGPSPPARPSGDPALVATETEEYFGGPVQVRTSLPLAFVATLVSSGAYALFRALFGMAQELGLTLPQGAQAAAATRLAAAANAQVGPVLMVGLFAPLPFAVVLILAHGLLKAWGKSSSMAYILAGLGAPFCLVLALGPVGLIFGLQAALPLALSMAVYRNMAGLEPVPVKADIFVRDRRDLVGASHARRQFGRLVKS